MSSDEIVDNLRQEDDSFSHDPHFEPIILLPEIIVPIIDKDEDILIQQRAKLFRLDKKEREWKERGTGEVKLLHHRVKNTVRIVMHREKTLKLCANHYITSEMDLKRNCGSDRAWVWTTGADFADGEPQPEVLAIKFLNSDMANKWKNKFDEGKEIMSKYSEKWERERSSSTEDDVNIEAGENDQDVTLSSTISECEQEKKESEEVINDLDKLNLTDDSVIDENVSTEIKE